MLEPAVLERVVSKLIKEKEKRTGSLSVNAVEPVETVIDRITQEMKIEIQSQYVAKYNAFSQERNPKVDQATHTGNALRVFEPRWSNLKRRLELVSGKQTLKKVREYYQANWGITLTTTRIIQGFQVSEIPQELQDLINQINQFRLQS